MSSQKTKLTNREIELFKEAIAFGSFGAMNPSHSISLLISRLSFEVGEDDIAKISEAFSQSLRTRPKNDT